MTIYETLTHELDELDRGATLWRERHREFAVALARGFGNHIGAPQGACRFRSRNDDVPGNEEDLVGATGFSDDGWSSAAFAVTFRTGHDTVGVTRVAFTFLVQQRADGWYARFHPTGDAYNVGEDADSPKRAAFYDAAVTDLRTTLAADLAPWAVDRGQVGFHV